MSADDIERQIHEYYRSITPMDVHRVEALVAASIERRRRRPPAGWRGWQLGGAAVMVAVIAVVVLSAPLLLGPALTPVASSSQAPGATGSATLPPASASPSAGQAGPWKTLVASTGAGASWSPDGRYLAVWSVSASGANQDIRLLDRDARPIRSLDADRIVWLDATRFLLVRNGSAFLGSVDSDALSPISESFDGEGLSNGHGAIALTTADAADPSKTHFVVWTPAGVSNVVTGQPVAWSADGTRLAVWLPSAQSGPGGVGYHATGRVEILAWPGLETLASIADDSLVPQPTSFDPSGQYLLVSRLGEGGSFVVDVKTGKGVGPSSITVSGTSDITWGSNSDVLVSNTDGSVTTYPIPGTEGARQAGLGDSAAASADGSTIVYYFTQDYSGNPRPITLSRGGTRTSLPVPGGLESDPVISLDGSGIVVFCLVDHGLSSERTEALLLVG
jgi:dipeptidyl aminopeptidase/acylaminoacyl peptidase